MSKQISRRLYEGLFIVSLTVALFFLVSLLTYEPSDAMFQWFGIGETSNSGGRIGAWFADKFFYLFGAFAYGMPVVMVLSGVAILKQQYHAEFSYSEIIVRVIGLFFIFCAGTSLISLAFLNQDGGLIGLFIADSLSAGFNTTGSGILLSALFLIGVTLFTGVSWMDILEAIGKWMCYGVDSVWRMFGSIFSAIKLPKLLLLLFKSQTRARVQKAHIPEKIQPQLKVEIPKVRPQAAAPKPVRTVIPEPATISIQTQPQTTTLPSMELLDPVKTRKGNQYSHAQLEHLSETVEQKLLDFGVNAQVVSVHPGPVITRFELQLAPGVKVSKITGLAKDLARALSVVSVRVVEVIPGKPFVGLELPNDHREMVQFKEVLATDQFRHALSPLSLALGVDIAGHPVIVDLAKMPHLLVAGTTGSGKSVGLNAMILSLLFKSRPEDVRLILIDPKMLELSVYDNIPHLLSPVITDMKESAGALRWAVAEMERRYRLMAGLGVRNLAGFNKKVLQAVENGDPIADPVWQPSPGDSQHPVLEEKLPMIVIVIDELADMMMVVGKQVEQLIARIAQKARAAGIHLILATQRPSVDVLTGLIKSNIPTRISFQVSSKIDSRTILDQQGADQLLGHGDMLYLAPGTGAPVRVHGAFVDDHEVHKVADAWRAQGQPEYIDNLVYMDSDVDNMGQSASDLGAVEDTDTLYDQVVEFVTSSRKVSISSVQRRFKIGYNRSARLVEEMERTGVVSPMESNGARVVLAPAVSMG